MVTHVAVYHQVEPAGRMQKPGTAITYFEFHVGTPEELGTTAISEFNPGKLLTRVAVRRIPSRYRGVLARTLQTMRAIGYMRYRIVQRADRKRKAISSNVYPKKSIGKRIPGLGTRLERYVTRYLRRSRWAVQYFRTTKNPSEPRTKQIVARGGLPKDQDVHWRRWEAGLKRAERRAWRDLGRKRKELGTPV
ncbi:hypothetical protein HY572_01585 [Candidatus Micrarchaeota archaeon]|nr:hypothetical protein [Candidatus Micrarchaeota archaeon]